MSLSLGDRVLTSSALMMLVSTVNRTLGIVSMLILARLLTPGDYGLVAIAMMVLAFVQLFAETGISNYILSRRELTENHLNTAWTLRLITRVVTSAVVFSIATPAATYYSKDELESVIRVIALVPLLQGLTSIGEFVLSRELQYKKVAVFSFGAKLFSFIVTVFLAWYLKSYWALIIGDVAFTLALMIGSYVIHDYRPRLSFKGLRAQWDFTKWIYIAGLFGFCRSKSDIFLVSRLFDTEMLGIFNLSKEIALLPEQQTVRPLGNIFITSINENKDDSLHTADIVIKLFTCLVSILLPASIGMYIAAPWFVAIALGDQWLSAVPILQALAILSCMFGCSSCLRWVLLALEKVKQILILDIITFCMTIIMLIIAAQYSLEAFAWARSASGFITLALSLYYLGTLIPIKTTTLLLALLPSTFASIIMASIMYLSLAQLQLQSDLSILLSLFFIGLATFSGGFLLFNRALVNHSLAHRFILSNFKVVLSRIIKRVRRV